MVSIGSSWKRSDVLAGVLRGEELPMVPWVRYVLSLVICIFFLAARYAILPVNGGLAFVTFYPAVAISALLFGAGAGLFAVAISAAVASFLFLPPLWSFSMKPDGGLSVAIFVFSGILICFLAHQMRRHAKVLRQSEQRLLLAASVFHSSQEGIWIAAPDGKILEVNKAFTNITGYAAPEAKGNTPRMLQAGRHDAAFYAEMWETLTRTQEWAGEVWSRRKNGDVYPEWLSITAVKGKDGAIAHYVGTISDISHRKAAQDEVSHLAYFDSITDLPNRRLLTDRLNQAITASARSGHTGALLFIDLDNFKNLNDSAGREKGDRLLKLAARRIVGCVRESDTVARFGGDEFVVMLQNLSQNAGEATAQTRMVGEKILAALDHSYGFGSHRYHSTCSIGVALFSGDLEPPEELLKQADLAMYQAKQAGRNAIRFFDRNMQAMVSRRAKLEATLRQGLGKNEFLLYYQPQFDRDDRLTGVEALLRWQHPQRGLVLPTEFIPIAEETGLILPLGHWVLETACAQLAAWAARPERAHLTMAINVSPLEFQHADFERQMLSLIGKTGVNPNLLKLELTETMLVHDVEATIAKMTSLKAYGLRFCLDDFGAGFSSLSCVKRLPLDQLKIDQSFVRDVLTDPGDAAVANTIIALGKSLGIGVIAEGVETEEQREFLARNGCHAFQGYLFSRPLPLEAFEDFAAVCHRGSAVVCEV
jgi:diguanylate cyclase (GGDEF)-like protein/PAS domain S-box-containing protein